MSATALLAPMPLPDSRRLRVTLAISFALHASIILLVGFTFPDAARTMQEKALDIILVNAKSARKPVNAQALAQSHLDGGGNTEEDRRARTPLPPTQQQVAGTELEQAQRRVKELEAQQQQILTQARSIRANAVARNGQDQPLPATVSGLDLAESARAMARLEGEINKSVDEYNKRPRKKFLGTRAEEYALAPYLDAWKQKIERIGTLNYPEAARGKVYGAVVIYVELRAEDGSLYNAEISRSSGHKVLDEAALRILRMAAPFGPIPRDALGGATVLSFARTWQFTQGDAFNTAVAK